MLRNPKLFPDSTWGLDVGHWVVLVDGRIGKIERTRRIQCDRESGKARKWVRDLQITFRASTRQRTVKANLADVACTISPELEIHFKRMPEAGDMVIVAEPSLKEFEQLATVLWWGDFGFVRCQPEDGKEVNLHISWLLPWESSGRGWYFGFGEVGLMAQRIVVPPRREGLYPLPDELVSSQD